MLRHRDLKHLRTSYRTGIFLLPIFQLLCYFRVRPSRPTYGVWLCLDSGLLHRTIFLGTTFLFYAFNVKTTRSKLYPLPSVV